MLLLKLLSEPAHFKQAYEERWLVAVYKDSCLVEDGYPIEMFNSNTVKIAGTYYFVEECKFEGRLVILQTDHSTMAQKTLA
ncbi:hypothetical protein [Paenibacillus herberti]|uniref:Uncharacterized protein n=1 Tax=Paenibacillus herberti TaxID=1619309 RepID=A0A229P0Q5_9BACL|nr:hypothetical protein [Paenibacillus herberti]OXM15772.1 hypothetical protein CGZ75_03365 [Paenibacillus herberti]